MTGNETRLNELELKFTEQQALLQELSDVVYQQQQLLDLLKSEVQVLQKKLHAEPGLVDAQDRERPPHY
jgi:SlyX protein